MMKRIAVLTSGGDAPGMNAAIRAVTRCALDQGWDVFGVRHGYVGLIEGHFTPVNARSVGGIIQQGGTMLGSTRCLEFTTADGRAKALTQIQHHNVDGLVVVGGDGSQKGAAALSQMGVAAVGVASTIDNDLAGSDYGPRRCFRPTRFRPLAECSLRADGAHRGRSYRHSRGASLRRSPGTSRGRNVGQH
jgi:6-phosphofructokinase 1